MNTTPIVSACPAALSDVKTFVQNVPLGIEKNNVDVTVPARMHFRPTPKWRLASVMRVLQ